MGSKRGYYKYRDEIQQEAGCPQCKVPEGTACDWAKSRWLPVAERLARQAEGRSHMERMLVAYGKSVTEAAEIARGNRRLRRAGGAASFGKVVQAAAVECVACPACKVPRGTRCPVGTGVCQARKRKLVQHLTHRLPGPASRTGSPGQVRVRDSDSLHGADRGYREQVPGWEPCLEAIALGLAVPPADRPLTLSEMAALMAAPAGG